MVLAVVAVVEIEPVKKDVTAFVVVGTAVVVLDLEVETAEHFFVVVVASVVVIVVVAF